MCVAGIGSDSCGNMWDFSCCKTRFLPCKLQVKTGFWVGGLEGNEDVIGRRYLIYLPIPTAPNLLSTWGFSTKCWCRGTCNRGTARWCESLRCTRLLIYAMHWSVNGMISGSAYMSLPAVQFNCCLILLGDVRIVEENVDTLKTQGFDQGVSLSVWVGPANPNTFPHLSWGQHISPVGLVVVGCINHCTVKWFSMNLAPKSCSVQYSVKMCENRLFFKPYHII